MNMKQAAKDLVTKFPHADSLHPELQKFLCRRTGFGDVLQHPLVYCLFVSQPMYGVLNAQYEAKTKHLADRAEAGDWMSYVFLYERPYRLTAFLTIHRKLTDEMYWGLLGDIWVDSENIWQYKEMWGIVLDTQRGGREAIMSSDEDRARLAELKASEGIVAYRGTNGKGTRRGLSWTIDREKAEWFSKRLCRTSDRPRVYSATFRGDDIIAYFGGRRESEIVVTPAAARSVKISKV